MEPVIKGGGGDLTLSRVMMQEPSDAWDNTGIMLLMHSLRKRAIKGIGSLRKQNPVVRWLDVLNDINECAN